MSNGNNPSPYQNRVMAAPRPSLMRQAGQRRIEQEEIGYDWRVYSPNETNALDFLRWLVVGGAKFAPQTDEELQSSLADLALCLTLLRKYSEAYDMPEKGGPMSSTLV